MKVVDLEELKPEEGSEIFYEADEFSGRIIELPAGGKMPPCDMDSYVIFYIISGEVVVWADEEKTRLQEGNCLITRPATMKMKTEEGVRILGVQVKKG